MVEQIKDESQLINKITKRDITEIKSMKVPVQIIHDVLTCVCLLLGYNNTKWTDIQKHLNLYEDFMQKLKTLDISKVDKSVIQKINADYIQNNKIGLTKVKSTSIAAHQLFCWVLAMVNFSAAQNKQQQQQEDQQTNKKNEEKQLQQQNVEKVVVQQEEKTKIEKQETKNNVDKSFQNIDRKGLVELRSYKQPPPAVHDVLTCVSMICGNKDHSWQAIKLMLANEQLFKNISAKSVDFQILSDINNNFILNNKINANQIKMISVVAAQLFEWVQNLVNTLAEEQ